VKRTLFFATLLLTAVAVLTTSCGTSDSIKSLLLTSASNSGSNFYNLAGQDGTIQLKVLAVYNSGKQIDVTTASTFAVVPSGWIYSTADPNYPAGGALPPYGPTTVPINKTGLMTGIVAICTWVDNMDTTKSPPVPANPPVWAYTGYYQTTASYRGFTSQPVAIGVGVAESNAPAGGCGPS
jgi:hypothetical protein